MKYRNVKTGVVIDVPSQVVSEQWELISHAPTPVVEEKPEEVKKTRKKKEV